MSNKAEDKEKNKRIQRTFFRRSQGSTLIELIIYIALVTGFLSLISGFVWQAIRGDIKAMVYREVQQNGRFAMEKMIRAVRAGQATSTFSVSDNILYQDLIPLTTDRVKVTNLQFVSVDNGYQINLSLEYDNESNRSEYDSSIDLQSAVFPKE